MCYKSKEQREKERSEKERLEYHNRVVEGIIKGGIKRKGV